MGSVSGQWRIFLRRILSAAGENEGVEFDLIGNVFGHEGGEAVGAFALGILDWGEL